MTHDEVVDLLEELFNAYPNNPIKDAGGTIRTWEREFGSDDASKIYKAARHHMNTNRYFPNVADIRKSINKGQMLYGEVIQEQTYIEAPQAPHIMIPVTDNFCDLCGLCDKHDQSLCDL